MRFIRKGGRVIPIREDRYKTEKRTAKAGAAAIGAGGIVTGLEGARDSEKYRTRWFKKKYADELRAAGSPKMYEHKSHRFGARAGLSNIGKHEIHFDQMGRNEHMLLHELGHIRMAGKPGTMNHRYATKGFPPQPMRVFTHLAAEAEASGAAIGMASKRGGWRAGLKMARKLAPPYATYLGLAMITGAGMSAATKAILPKRRKDQK